MTVEGKAITTTDVAIVVTTLEADALDQHLMSLPPELVAEFAVRAAAVARIAGQAKTVAHARLREMGQAGNIFRDPLDGTPYHFTGGRHRKIKNVAGLIEQLVADGVSLRAIVPWLASGAIKVAKEIEGDPAVALRVDDFAEWVDDPLSLVQLDPQTMKPVRRGGLPHD